MFECVQQRGHVRVAVVWHPIHLEDRKQVGKLAMQVPDHGDPMRHPRIERPNVAKLFLQRERLVRDRHDQVGGDGRVLKAFGVVVVVVGIMFHTAISNQHTATALRLPSGVVALPVPALIAELVASLGCTAR